MEDRLQKLKHELEMSLKKGLATTNDGIKDLRSWVGLIVGIFGVGIMLEIVLYDRCVEERLEKGQGEMETRLERRQGEMETRLTTMIQDSITHLTLELRFEHQERVNDQEKKRFFW
ncbi:hypothetical protein DFP73DRAFT_591028 [Morchella snyderi]|nr:hypothetical protein DFP73DRAFT_591028 [Morchella snyderi]